jgi:anti-sigma B factor antagonist
MSFRSTRVGDTVVIGIEGQLVAGNRQQLREAVTSEIERSAKAFVIDFVDTGYVDSAGLGVLVSLSKKIREADASLRLVNLNDDLRTLFELTRLDTLFNLDDRTGSSTAIDADQPSSASPRPGGAASRPTDDEARP